MNTKKYYLYIFFISIIILLATILYQVNISFSISNGESYTYPLDDTYIHLSVAKHLTTKGIWGISDTFAGASSSPLYTLLLALTMKIFGDNPLIPIMLNSLFGIVFLFVLYKIAQKYLSAIPYFVLSIAAIFLSPLCGMVILGMEHTLHITLIVSLLYIILTFDENNSNDFFKLFIFTIGCVGTRYESLFFVAVFFFYLIFQKLYKAGFYLAIASLIPVLIYGFSAISQGGYFLPNALLVKGTQPELSIEGIIHFLGKGLFKINHTAHIKALFDVLWIGFIGFFILNSKKEKYFQFEKWHFSLVALFLILILHLCFADVGWFYRYEAYLIMLCLIVILGVIENSYHKFQEFSLFNKVFYVLLSVTMILYSFIPLINRSKQYFHNAPIAMKNIYQQQRQMAKFTKLYYDNSGIMLGDIGAVSYFSNAKVLDMIGLGNNQLLRRKKTENTKQILTDMSEKQQTEIGIIYKKYMQGDMPSNWIEVASWTIPHNFVCGDSTVNFYAKDSIHAKVLHKNLILYSSQLPKDVKVDYLFDKVK